MADVGKPFTAQVSAILSQLLLQTQISDTKATEVESRLRLAILGEVDASPK